MNENLGITTERIFPLPERIRLARVLWFFVFFFCVGALFSAVGATSPELFARLAIPAGVVRVLSFSVGLFYLTLALSCALFLINACVSSYAQSGTRLFIREPWWRAAPAPSFDARVMLASVGDSADAFSVWSTSFLGREILARLGITPTAVSTFLEQSRSRISLPVGEYATLSTLTAALFNADQGAAIFLASHGTAASGAVEAAAWVERQMETVRREKRWWSRERLGRIRGIGKTWSYGSAWRLSRYAREFSDTPIFARARSEVALVGNAIDQLESVLSRTRESNALLVGEAGSAREGVIAGLAARIASGGIFPALEHKRIAVFDVTAFAAEMKTKSAFEGELVRVMNDAARAGNLIMVFPNFPELIESATEVGSDVGALLADYLSGSRVQIIALAESGAYHTTLSPHRELLTRFERIMLPAPNEKTVLPYAQDEALRIEASQRVFFLSPTVETAIQAAGRYFMGESLADKTADLLHEAAVAARKEHRRAVVPADVLAIVQARAGIPVAALSSAERATLLELEGTLRRRVIGQERALAAVAGALRRARAGVANPKRPFGSFLFLGPTGVGKTETAKALAGAFFDGEDTIRRIDFSEYRTADALERIMKTLSESLRERPYGVLLLDEFEKTTTEVRHLFLQILDEGFFTDAGGKKVNCRNLLIIATSNAGSDLIWEVGKRGAELAEEKARIVDVLVQKGAFTPELLNRFDGVILFEPLTGKNLRAVAEMLLKKLVGRMQEKGILFIPTARIVDAVVEAGSNPHFGARAMQRAIQDRVERALADKILRGSLRPGDRVELSPEEL